MVDFNCTSERLWPWAACTLLESLLNWGLPILAFVGVFVYHYFTGYTFSDDQKVPEGIYDNLGPDAGMYLEKTGYLKSKWHLKWWWALTAITVPMHVYAAYLALGLCGKCIVWAFNWHIRDEDWSYQFVKPFACLGAIILFVAPLSQAIMLCYRWTRVKAALAKWKPRKSREEETGGPGRDV